MFIKQGQRIVCERGYAVTVHKYISDVILQDKIVYESFASIMRTNYELGSQ